MRVLQMSLISAMTTFTSGWSLTDYSAYQSSRYLL